MTPEAFSVMLIGVGVISIGMLGLFLFAYEALRRRGRLRSRVGQLVPAGQGEAPASAGLEHPWFRRGLMTAGLRGEELQFARLIAPLHIPADRAVGLLLGLRLVLAGLGPFALIAVGSHLLNVSQLQTLLGLGLVGAVLGWVVPGFILKRVVRYRTRAISQGLPEAIELLVIGVEAGLSLDEAMNRIVAELQRTQPAVAEELALTSADLRVLPDRDDALRRLADRVDLPSVHSVVTTLAQTLRYGTPLAQALRVVAAELRNDALLKLEEQANRLPVLLTIPMIGFILPSLMMVIGGPAFLKILDILAR